MSRLHRDDDDYEQFDLDAGEHGLVADSDDDDDILAHHPLIRALESPSANATVDDYKRVSLLLLTKSDSL